VAFNIPENIGVANSVLNNDKGSPLEQLLINISQDICDQLKENLVKYDANTTSLGLSQSIQPNSITYENNLLSVGIDAEYYWKFIDKGVNGAGGDNLKRIVHSGSPAWGRQPTPEKSFHQNILEWIPKRGVIKPDSFETYDQYAWAIMRSIIKYGKQPKPFFTDVMNTNLAEIMRPQIEALLVKAIEIKITQPWQ